MDITRPSNQSVIDYWEERNERHSGRFIRHHTSSLKRFKEFMKDKNISFSRLTPGVCKKFRNYLYLDCGLATASSLSYLTAFKQMVKEAVEDKLLLENPCHGVTIKHNGNQLYKQVLTVEEIQRLASAEGDDLVKTLFILACYTGMGLADLRSLRRQQVKDGRLVKGRNKTGELISFKLHPVAESMLERSNGEGDSVFKIPWERTVDKKLKQLVANAGIDKRITFYCARHTFVDNNAPGGS